MPFDTGGNFADYSNPDPWGLNSMVGVQSDGTNLLSFQSTIVTPADAGGGQPADYGAAVLDIFKFGVGAWSQANAQQQILDYKRFEATNGGLYQQGKTAALPAAANHGGISKNAMLAIGAVLLFMVLTHKGG